MELPKVDKLQNMTSEQVEQYIRFVAELRHNQRRWFKFKEPSALNLSRQMEKELDGLNGRLLNPIPSLFD